MGRCFLLFIFLTYTNHKKERDAMTQPKTALAYLRSEKAKAEQKLLPAPGEDS